MTVNLVDSALFGNLFCTAEMRAAFDDRMRIGAMAEVEAALARAQASVGIIPQIAAQRITEAAGLDAFDMDALRGDTERIGYPVMPLVRQLSSLAGDEAGRFVHWGATTQDIMDTGLVLQMRRGVELLKEDLSLVVAALASLADRHRHTVMAGRTHMQHALPITFGFKCATWLSPLLTSRKHLHAVSAEVLKLQFSGAVGTLASLGEHGGAVAEALARELDLPMAPVAWHAGRDGIARICSELSILCGALGKIATDIVLLMQTEVAEVFEPPAAGRGGSSTMPQKRNPVLSEYILAASRNVHGLSGGAFEALFADHERATGPWHGEWLVVPQVFALSSGALRHGVTVTQGLEVDAERMRANLDLTGGLIMAEAVMMALAPHIGRDPAHDLVEELCRGCGSGGGSFRELLVANKAIASHLTARDVDRLLDPAHYTGRADDAIDAVLALV